MSTTQDTFERSCEHWSEEGRDGMEHFYVLATEDYRQLALSTDWVGWLGERAAAAGRPLRLLDVACGSGKFPTALRMHAGLDTAGLASIDYQLLDPSAFSLAEAAGCLAPPFVAGQRYECRLQDLADEAGTFDVVWATHALYAIPEAELGGALSRFVAGVAPGGKGFIAHACQDAHYIAFYRQYLEHINPDATPYSTAEQLVSTFEQLGATVATRDIEYHGTVAASESEAVEGYLQRCLFDDSMSLAQMRDHPALGEYLSRCLDGDTWRFRQRVKLFFIDSAAG